VQAMGMGRCIEREGSGKARTTKMFRGTNPMHSTQWQKSQGMPWQSKMSSR